MAQTGIAEQTSNKTKLAAKTELRDSVVIRFAGDSGDGMQLVGDQFTSTCAMMGNDVATLPKIIPLKFEPRPERSPEFRDFKCDLPVT